MNPKLTAEHLEREAIVYIRQSTPNQVRHHLEGQRLQYALQDRARQLGFRQVAVIDDDLGRSALGMADRRGFDQLVRAVCTGSVGAIFCLEASRLARNGREWQGLIEARQVLLWFRREGISPPRKSQDQPGAPTIWAPPPYSALHSLLSNPIYGGAYAFGRTQTRTQVIEGRARKTAGHKKPRSEWTVLILDHHQ